ncbi:MAG: SDR family oxidoreductase [Bacteroidetes bacterium]|nr:MAG: SDR family oxidoreductase [Bacteroidota bacterium]
MEIRFDNKIILITGASRGIGAAAARLFAESGATVVIHFNQDKEAAGSVLKSLPGTNHFLAQADTANPDDLHRMVEKVIGRYGRIDILVNNAGIYDEHDMVNMQRNAFLEYWDKTISVNLTGPAFLAYLAAREMISLSGGRIVNVTSRGAFRGEPTAWAYGAAKAGLNATGQSMAKALAPHGVYVFTLAPGFVETDMTAPCLAGEKRNEIEIQSPLKRIAQPEEIARAILLLAAEGNEYMTGCILDMNGASYLRT